MATVLVTGANRGIGLEFVRQYAAAGDAVIACCRNPDKADQLTRLAGEYSTIRIIELDVTDHDRIGAVAAELKDVPIDILISNAGLLYSPSDGRKDKYASLGRLDYGEWRRLFEVNVLGAIGVAEALIPNVAQSDDKKIVIVTSRMGSIADNDSGGSYAYRSTKAAVNAAVKSLSIDVADDGISCIVVHPGWVQTDMGGPSALISAEESVSGLRRVIGDLTSGKSGHFYNFSGEELPW